MRIIIETNDNNTAKVIQKDKESVSQEKDIITINSGEGESSAPEQEAYTSYPEFEGQSSSDEELIDAGEVPAELEELMQLNQSSAITHYSEIENGLEPKRSV